jgi:pimeloyl-ACP methyl ester carboxylesterase
VLARDARAAVLAAAGQPGVRARCIGLWGHSQGGWIAPLAAAGDDTVAFLIVVAGSGVTPHEQMIYATATLMREAGYAEQDVDHVTRLRNRLLELAHDRRSLDEARRLIREAAAQPWYALTYLPDPAAAEIELEDEIAFEWNLDIAPALAQLQIPVLLIHGEEARLGLRELVHGIGHVEVAVIRLSSLHSDDGHVVGRLGSRRDSHSRYRRNAGVRCHSGLRAMLCPSRPGPPDERTPQDTGHQKRTTRYRAGTPFAS